ncbi:hypothetical protein QQS21_007311 [Conoideocrella luteorostrata]|uniref:Uncharacterized protein n=1 Tax=Conoideocrella luteorostrata TaxID=1105319 RepID=A0AAJ0CKX4_9HYPO|nr:hypothetical protein QQS21_007311 [Conoideocrella luteorostrata]
MAFETLVGYLETYAADVDVMVLNIKTMPYRQLLGNLKDASFDANACCDLGSRVLHLEGFDAGIIIEQSQGSHSGPLQSQARSSHPTLALPYLSQGRGYGSMLAWVCWDEFVNLESPYAIREHDFQASSPEIGRLMSALSTAAMSKLAAMRTTAPVILERAEDTVTKLMRGLFGNLLTQLFRERPQYDIPTTDAEWVWYKTVVALYPYTGWPLEQFHENLEKLFDKALVRVVTKAENVTQIKSSPVADMIKCCKLRNIQLEHSRTIITIFMRMLTTQDMHIPRCCSSTSVRPLSSKLEKQTEGYTRMIKYLDHLAKGGQRRAKDDLIAANVYIKRSTAFAELKSQVAESCRGRQKVSTGEDRHNEQPKEFDFAQFKSLQPDFVTSMQRELLAEDVRHISKIPALVMRVFIKAPNPEFVWEDLGYNFKVIMLRPVRERSNRVESRPVKRLFKPGSRSRLR